MSRKSKYQENLVNLIDETLGPEALENYLGDWIEHYQNLVERKDAEEQL